MNNKIVREINVKGYASPRAFSGFQIPIPLQSMALRRYCEDRKYAFNHHVVENITPNSYLVLERVANEAHQYQAIAMCSIGLLPSDSTQRDKILEKCIRAGTSVHFVFEQLVLNSLHHLEELNHLLNLAVISGKQIERVALLRDFLDS